MTNANKTVTQRTPALREQYALAVRRVQAAEDSLSRAQRGDPREDFDLAASDLERCRKELRAAEAAVSATDAESARGTLS
jgi:hypothetical protein